jgi:hypothetical protein
MTMMCQYLGTKDCSPILVTTMHYPKNKISKTSLFLILLPVLTLIFFCISDNQAGETNCKNEPEITSINTATNKPQAVQFTSTMDSLQGTWHIEDEVASKIVISGTSLDEYSDTGVHKYYTIYFSDTPTSETEVAKFSLNASATDGAYFIEVENSTGAVWCYRINNVSGNTANSVFSITHVLTPHPRTMCVKE